MEQHIVCSSNNNLVCKAKVWRIVGGARECKITGVLDLIPAKEVQDRMKIPDGFDLFYRRWKAAGEVQRVLVRVYARALTYACMTRLFQHSFLSFSGGQINPAKCLKASFIRL
jgi:hypothetical protein